MVKQRYVLGFMFDPSRQWVLLILKNNPEWQRGRLNGIGGKLEDSDESLKHAMSREFLEETSVLMAPDEWRHCATMESKEWIVDVFSCVHEKAQTAKTVTKEMVGLFYVHNLHMHDVIPNLHWLIPMALDDMVLRSEITYREGKC